jgi:site-specific DNA-methyltransferase (adenine-specific)
MGYTLYNKDCIEVLKGMPDGMVDLVVTSPPYDDLRGYNSVVDWESLAKELYRVVADGGVVVWNVNDKTENGSKSLTSFKQCILFNEVGFNVNDVMIWEKVNPIPQVKQPRYTQCFEYMFVFSKGTPKTFNPIMVECKYGGSSFSGKCKQISKDKVRKHKDYKINNQKVDRNIWKIKVANNKTPHPAVFPIELPNRHIVSWSNPGDIVLDPFMGSGTTGVSAIQNDRIFIGMEIDKDYFELSEKQIKEAVIESNSKLW